MTTVTPKAPKNLHFAIAESVMLAHQLWDASDAFAIEAMLWTGQARIDCRRSADHLAHAARSVLRGRISVAEAEAFTEASRKVLGRVAGARRLRDSIRAPRKGGA